MPRELERPLSVACYVTPPNARSGLHEPSSSQYDGVPELNGLGFDGRPNTNGVDQAPLSPLTVRNSPNTPIPPPSSQAFYLSGAASVGSIYIISGSNGKQKIVNTEIHTNGQTTSGPPKSSRIPVVMENDKHTATRQDPWLALKQFIEEYDEGMCRGWDGEIQNQIVIATILAGIVTAFTIESHKWLENDPTQTTAKMLIQLSAQLANFSNPTAYHQVLDSTLSFDPEPPRTYGVAVNILWLLSLSTCLFTVLLGALCLEWLCNFRHDPRRLPPQEAILRRQRQYTELFKWRVPQIISFLPNLLRLSVILFFLGLLRLLYALDYCVATTITSVTVVIPLILILAAIFPIVRIVSKLFAAKPSPKAWVWDSIKEWPTKFCFWRTKSPQGTLAADSGLLWTIENLGHQSDVFLIVYNMISTLDMDGLRRFALECGYSNYLGLDSLPPNPPYACATLRLAILSSLPLDSWRHNSWNEKLMLKQLEACMSSASPESICLIPFLNLGHLLYRFYSVYINESGAEHELQVPLSSLIAACHCWAKQGIFHHEEWNACGGVPPLTPRVLLLRLTRHALESTKELNFVSRGGRYLLANEIAICNVALELYQHSDCWDDSDREVYEDVIIVYAEKLSTRVRPWVPTDVGAIRNWGPLRKLVAEIRMVAMKLVIIDLLERECPQWNELYTTLCETQLQGDCEDS